MKGKLLGTLLILAFSASAAAAGDTGAAARAGIDEFNRALIQATTRMDNAATLALWEDDGIDLLPQTDPIVGKKALAKFYDDVMKDLAGARMEKFELKCFDMKPPKIGRPNGVRNISICPCPRASRPSTVGALCC